MRKQRPMQVVHHDNHVEARRTQRGVSGFEIHDLSIDGHSPPPRLSIDDRHRRSHRDRRHGRVKP